MKVGPTNLADILSLPKPKHHFVVMKSLDDELVMRCKLCDFYVAMSREVAIDILTKGGRQIVQHQWNVGFRPCTRVRHGLKNFT